MNLVETLFETVLKLHRNWRDAGKNSAKRSIWEKNDVKSSKIRKLYSAVFFSNNYIKLIPQDVF